MAQEIVAPGPKALMEPEDAITIIAHFQCACGALNAADITSKMTPTFDDRGEAICVIEEVSCADCGQDFPFEIS